MMLTPAGIKKNAIFSSRKSDFSRIWSTFRICTHNRMNSKIMPITLAGKENGRSFSIIWEIQQIEKIIPTCVTIFKS